MTWQAGAPSLGRSPTVPTVRPWSVRKPWAGAGSATS